MPPLRKRPSDIPLLSRHFLAKYSAKFNKTVSDISPDGIKKLVLHDWPGNVRELEYVMQRTVLFAETNIIGPSDLLIPRFKATGWQESFKKAKANTINQFEKDFVTKLLIAYEGNITSAAKAAQKDRRAFWELIRKHRIDINSLLKPFSHGNAKTIHQQQYFMAIFNT